MIERAFERRFGAANDRSNRRRELPAGADAKGSNGVDQLTKEGGSSYTSRTTMARLAALHF